MNLRIINIFLLLLISLLPLYDVGASEAGDRKKKTEDGASTAELVMDSALDTSLSSRTALEVVPNIEAEDTTPTNEGEENTSNHPDAESVWRVENGKVARINMLNYVDFDATKVYIVVHQATPKVGEDSSQTSLFYWVGERSAEEDAVFAATYAVSNVNSAITRREALRLESDPFKTIFNIEEAGDVSVRKTAEIIQEYNTRTILMGSSSNLPLDVTEVQEVKFSTKCINDSSVCCIAFNSFKVYSYCGSYAPALVQKLAEKLSVLIPKKVVPGAAMTFRFLPYNMHTDKYAIKKLQDEFERIAKTIKNHQAEVVKTSPKSGKKGTLSVSNIFTLGKSSDRKNDVEQVQDNTPIILLDKITVLHIFVDKNTGEVQEAANDPALPLIFPFRSQDCYLVDPCIGHIGLLVWLGENSNAAERAECAKRAELLLRENKHCNLRPIIIIDENHSDLKQFPKVFGTVRNLIDLLQKLNLSWEEILLEVPTPTQITTYRM